MGPPQVLADPLRRRRVVRDDAGRVRRQDVADGPRDQVALLVHEARPLALVQARLHVLVEALEVGQVGLHLLVRATVARGAQDDRHPVRHLEAPAQLAHAVALLARLDAARGARTVGVREQDDVAPRQRDARGQRRTLVPDGTPRDLHQDVVPGLHEVHDRAPARRGGPALFLLAPFAGIVARGLARVGPGRRYGVSLPKVGALRHGRPPPVGTPGRRSPDARDAGRPRPRGGRAAPPRSASRGRLTPRPTRGSRGRRFASADVPASGGVRGGAAPCGESRAEGPRTGIGGARGAPPGPCAAAPAAASAARRPPSRPSPSSPPPSGPPRSGRAPTVGEPAGGSAMSEAWRNPVTPCPRSTKAAPMPRSTFWTRPT